MTDINRIYDQLLDGKQLPPEEVYGATLDWLDEAFDIVDIKDPLVVADLVNVHNHDNQPLHFSRPRINNAFQNGTMELVKLPHGWHLGIQIGNSNPLLLHPKQERRGMPADPYSEQQLTQLRQLLLKGTHATLKLPTEDNSAVPAPILSQIEELHKVEDNAGEPVLLETSVVSSQVSQQEGSSITLDMSQYVVAETPEENVPAEEVELVVLKEETKKKRFWGRK